MSTAFHSQPQPLHSSAPPLSSSSGMLTPSRSAWIGAAVGATVGVVACLVASRALHRASKKKSQRSTAQVAPAADDSPLQVRVTDLAHLVVPQPYATPSTVFTCAHALPAGVIMRRGTSADHAQLFDLMRTVAVTRGGLAREVDEMNAAYIDGMLDSLDGGLMLVCEFQEAGSDAAPTLVAVLKSGRLGPHRCFRGVLGDTTLAVHPRFQNCKLGQLLFARFFAELTAPAAGSDDVAEFAHVLRIELIARETNRYALAMYEKVGFRVQTKLHSRIVTGMPLQPSENDTIALQFEGDILMVAYNPTFDVKALERQFTLKQ